MRTRQILNTIVVISITIFVVSSSLFPAHTSAATGINSEISFEGKVVNTNNTNITDGTYNMEFKIYSGTSATGGTGDTLLWTEDWLVGSTQGGVPTTSGTYEVNLGAAGTGDSTALSNINFNQSPLWLSMQVGNTASCTITTTFQANCGGDGEMTPYILLTSSPYALNAGQVGGLNASQLAQLSPAAAQTGNINILGNVTAGGNLNSSTLDTAAAGGTLSIAPSNATTIHIATGTTTATTTVIGSTNASTTVSLQGGVTTELVNTSGVMDKSTTASTTAFQVQNTTGINVFSVNTSAGQILLGGASALNGQISFANTTNANTVSLVSGATSATYSLTLPTTAPATSQCLQSGSTTASQLVFGSCGGAASHIKTINIPAEYVGAVLDASNDSTCVSANAGTMTSGFYLSGAVDHNYYKWTTANTVAQCYDVVVRVPVPSDFSSWNTTTPITLSAYASDASAALNMEVRDTAGAVESSYSTFPAITPASGAWTSITPADALAGTYTPGGTMTIRLRMSSINNDYLELGDLKLSYNTAY